jgi:hypothetical protein
LGNRAQGTKGVNVLNRLLAMRHPDSEERTVRVVWRSLLVSQAVVWVMLLSIAVWLFWPPRDLVFWLVGVFAPSVGTAFGAYFLWTMGAFGQPPRGMWAASAANARRLQAEAEAKAAELAAERPVA